MSDQISTSTNVASSEITDVAIDNDWVNYLFDNQGDVQLDGQNFLVAMQKMKLQASLFCCRRRSTT